MSKEKSSSLFHLVKSLKKSEKRYFKLLGSRENGMETKKYIRLFDLIDGQQEFNESLILQNEPSFKAEQFSNLKAHLYKRILQSIRLYNSAKVVDIQIRELIDYVEILFNKGLYKQCADVLGKAKKIAVKSDNLELQLEVLKWEKNILSHTIDRDNQKRVNKIIQEVQKVNGRINHINTFSNLAVELNSLYLRNGFIRNQKDYNKVGTIFHNQMPQFQEEKLSFTEKLNLYQLYVGYYSFIQDFENKYKYARKWVDLFSDYDKLGTSRLEMYIKGLNNLMIAQSRLRKLDEFFRTKKKLRSLRKSPVLKLNENLNLMLLKYSYVHEFNGIFLVGDFTHGIRLIEKIKSGLEEFIGHLDNHSRIILYYKIACLYFGGGEYQKAVYWLNRIITFPKIDIREDVLSFSRILNLISHYELGNYEVIDYHIRSTYRFLLKKDNFNSYHKYILDFLKKLNQSITETSLIVQFQNLRDQLVPLENSPYEKRAFIYFDIISWLESKISGVEVQKIIKQKALQAA